MGKSLCIGKSILKPNRCKKVKGCLSKDMCGYLNCDKLMKCCSDSKSMKKNKKRTKRN